MIALAAAFGVLVCGWACSRLPAQYTAVAVVQRDYPRQPPERPARASDQDFAPARLLKEITAPAALNAVLHEHPAITADLDENQPLEDLRSRITAGVEPFSEASDRVWIRAAGSTPLLARQLSAQLAQQFVLRASRDTATKNQEECLTTAKRRLQEVESAWNLARQQLRELEAEREFSRDDATGARLGRAQEALEIARAQRDRIHQALSDPRARLRVTPPLVNPARHAEPSLAEATLARYIERREELAATFTPQHPAVRVLDQKIATLAHESGVTDQALAVVYKSVTNAPTSEHSALESRLRELDEKIVHLEEEATAASVDRDRQDRGLRDRLAAAQARAAAMGQERARVMDDVQRLRLAGNELLCSRSRLTVLDRADPSLRFEGYQRRRWFLAGAFCWLSLAGAATIVVLREQR